MHSPRSRITKSSAERWALRSFYLAGYSNYNQLYYTKASTQLTDVASGGGELGQNAAFHLGDCYLKLGDKQKALRAFVLASASDYSPEIKREAMLNAGKLQYELGGGAFNEAITTLAGYVQAYPDSPRIDEARELLLAAYFNSRNYEAAYEAIKQVRDPDNNVKAAMQKIAYFRALEQFQKEEYPGGAQDVRWADANRFNAKYSALTKFWRAETYARQGNYARAIPLYRDYIQLSPGTEYENKVAHYNLGVLLLQYPALGTMRRPVSTSSCRSIPRATTCGPMLTTGSAMRHLPSAITARRSITTTRRSA